MKFVLFYLPTVGTRKQIESGMLPGQNTQAYQSMLYQITEQVKAADQLGYYAAAFTEHHFHIEGLEVSNNPIMLSLYLGMQTKNIKLAQLANVLPFHNPIRVAEDIAMLDQMTKGRAVFGMARGYQKRWADVLGQVYGVGATFSDKSQSDARNRQLFDEHYKIIRKAWASETFSHKGDIWTIPPEGLEFAAHNAVRDYGRGMGEDGTIKEIGIAPKLYQNREIEIWQPFSHSEDTWRFCATENIVPFMLNTDDTRMKRLIDAYHEEALKVGREIAYGDSIGVFRDVLVAKTDEDAHRLAADGNGFVWPAWFGDLGFNEALRREGETGKIKGDFKDLCERGFEFIGTPDTVNRQIEHLVKTHNPEYLLMWQYPGLVPHEDMMRHMEMFATQVMPNWTDSRETKSSSIPV
ncbi:LLM class flavin-dependent oxidoreductase [Peribacillus glennii]|uniref:LLM class flavin-dependent oxidoreductase n=1 Tax=Peribacillus glennii TaxID=2303991 RepID=A0A372LFQ3_9BACI|nr:LLM class flavin-dependent oxidoreductase [Peribacillus glennii]RFU65128.1 LLM class flavin-dependent oxidoreductase [Peribacillus glennii]